MSDEQLGKSRTTFHLSDIPQSDLLDQFCGFFYHKIKRIREDLDSRICDPPTFAVFEGPLFSQFEPVTEKVIRELIIKSPTKGCMLDPIPTCLTKQCLNNLVSLITVIVSASLSAGIVPQQFKQALLKKPALDSNDMKNFRPVLNLPFISKIPYKVVVT